MIRLALGNFKVLTGFARELDLRDGLYSIFETRLEGDALIERETEKAILVTLTYKAKRSFKKYNSKGYAIKDGVIFDEVKNFSQWIPKSAIQKNESYLYIPEWVTSNNSSQLHLADDELLEKVKEINIKTN